MTCGSGASPRRASDVLEMRCSGGVAKMFNVVLWAENLGGRAEACHVLVFSRQRPGFMDMSL